MRKVYVVADASSKNIPSVHVLGSPAPGIIEECEQVNSPYVGEIQTVQAVDSAPGVKNIYISSYTPPGGGSFLLLRDGSSHLLLRDGSSKLMLGH